MAVKRRLILLGFLWIVILNNQVDCTQRCREALPTYLLTQDELEGNWYLVFSTNPANKGKDCSGFFGKKMHGTRGLIISVGGQTSNPTLSTDIRRGQILINPDDAREMYTYEIGFWNGIILCFYQCGQGDNYDSAQCFSKNQKVGNGMYMSVHSHLRHFGVTYADDDFVEIDRSECPTESRGGCSKGAESVPKSHHAKKKIPLKKNKKPVPLSLKKKSKSNPIPTKRKEKPVPHSQKKKNKSDKIPSKGKGKAVTNPRKKTTKSEQIPLAKKEKPVPHPRKKSFKKNQTT